MIVPRNVEHIFCKRHNKNTTKRNVNKAALAHNMIHWYATAVALLFTWCSTLHYATIIHQ